MTRGYSEEQVRAIQIGQDRVERKLDALQALVQELLQALMIREPEPGPEVRYTCPCTRHNGTPVGNCPICRGDGRPIKEA